ncbi:MAG: Hpt domain-containing protein [Nodosilinea sp.]
MMIEDEELQAIYEFTSKARLQTLRDGLLCLENDPDDAMMLGALQGEIHSLKGDSRSVGLETITVLTQQVEVILRSIQRQEIVLDAVILDHLSNSFNYLEALIHEAVTGEPNDIDIEQAITQLAALAPSLSPGNSLSPEPSIGASITVDSPESSLFIEDQELREIYQTTSLERLHQLETGLSQLAASPDSETMSAELLRQIHSLKGDARSIGIDAIFLLAQQVEIIFKAIQRQEMLLTSSISDRLAQGLVAIERLVNEAVTGEPSRVELESILSLLSEATPESLTPEPTAVIASSQSSVSKPALLIDEDQELREIYRSTSEERLLSLETDLGKLANHPEPTAVLETMRRQLHSLKGDSRSVGLETVSMIAQRLEAIVKHLQKQELTFIFEVSDALSQGLHVVRGLVHEAITGLPSDINLGQVLSQLAAVLESSAVALATATEVTIPSSSQTHDVVNATPPLIEDMGTVSSDWASLIEDEELRELYRITSEERLQSLEMGLLRLEHDPNDSAILAELMREAHSLKGDSRSIGVEAIEVLICQVEEILSLLQHQATVLTSEISDRLYLAVDVMKQVLHTTVTGEPSDVDVAEVAQMLTQLIVNLPGLDTTANQPQRSIVLQSESTLSAASEAIIDAELREIYKVTSEERLQRLEAGLVYLERHPDDQSRMAELMRDAHSLKGDAQSTGVEPVEVVSHQFEDVLGHIQRQTLELTPEVGDRLYQSLDAMRQFVNAAVTGEPSLLDPTLVLNQLLDLTPAAATSEIAAASLDPSDAPAILLPSTEPSRIDTIRVPTRSLDALIAQAEELTITKIQSAQITKQVEQVAALWQEWKANQRSDQALASGSLSVDPYNDQLEELISELRRSIDENNLKLECVAEELTDNIRTLRLLPLSTVFQTFPRMVRDLAKQQSKMVDLVIKGEETTADKQLLEGIKDALLHLIRNAIDHGIETVAERESLGKPAIAKLSLSSYQTTNSIVIEVSDDGRGLDIEQIKQTAIRRKLHTPDELEQMTPNQIYGLIMASGFSTRMFITEISGRGVGLDVVRTNVERLKGNIQIESTPNQGCTFRLQLSTALTTSNVILIDVQGIIHALPFEFLATTVVVSPDQVELVEGYETIHLNDQAIPVANLIDVLELIHSPSYALANKLQQARSERLSCVVLKVGEEQAGFFVDRLLETQEVVLKPQSQILKRVRNVMGATTLGSGEVCMVLNPIDLIRSLQKPVKAEPEDRLPKPVRRKSLILLVEDSLPVRTQEKRLFENAGYEVVIAVDGLDGYNKLKTQKFDAVVSDVEMPNLDGLSLTAKIRQDRAYDELPIILVTTLSSEDDRRRGAEAGANAYIAKGKFNQEALLETLARLV